MSTDPPFQGFPQEAVQLLLELRFNNNRTWYHEHKPRMDEFLLTPARLFAGEMAAALQEVVAGQPAARLSYSVMRMQRDTRFSADKTPYKNHLAILWWQGERAKFENPGFYFHIEPPSLILGGGIFEFSKPLLEAYRRAVDNPASGPQLEAAIQAAQANGPYKLGGQHYQRVPRDFPPDHPRGELLKHNGMYFSFDSEVPPEFYTAGLVEYCLGKYKAMAPLNAWLAEMVGRAEAFGA